MNRFFMVSVIVVVMIGCVTPTYARRNREPKTPSDIEMVTVKGAGEGREQSSMEFVDDRVSRISSSVPVSSFVSIVTHDDEYRYRVEMWSDGVLIDVTDFWW